MDASLEEMRREMNRRIADCHDTIESLNQKIERLKKDKEHVASQIFYRDLEIKRLREKREGQPHQLTGLLDELESSLNQAMEERKLQMDAMGFMADICTVEEGVGKLSPVWEKKRSKMRQDAVNFLELQRAMRTPQLAGVESTNTLPPNRTPLAGHILEQGEYQGPDRMASFINPYLKKAREEVVVPQEDEQVEGVVELVQELFKNLLDDDEEETFRDIIKDLRTDGAHQNVETVLQLEERPLSPTRSDVLSATDRTYKLKRIEQKVSNFKKIAHQIWQHIKFHQNELRKALKHEDEELAMLLNPLDKQAKRDESTQTALRLNLKNSMDYTPFSPIMQERPFYNPLLILLNNFRHQQIDQTLTMFSIQSAPALQKGILFSFINQAVDQRFKNFKSHLNFPTFFLDFMYEQFGRKSKVVVNFVLIYKTLKRTSKRSIIAKELMSLMGVGENLLSSTEEALVVKAILLFRELFAKQTLLRTSDSFPVNRSPTLDTPSPAAQYERMIDLYETATVNVQEVIDRLRRMGYASDTTVKEEGLLIFENIYSDYTSEGEDMVLHSALAKLELQEERQRKPHKRVFEIMDKEKKGAVPLTMLLTYIRESMQVQWTDSQINRVSQFFDPKNTEMVLKENFIEKMAQLNLKPYQRITLGGLVIALKRAQKRLLLQQAEAAIAHLRKYECNSLAEFENCVKSLEPTLKPQQILKFYKEVLETTGIPQNLDEIAGAQFFDLVEKHKLGGFGKDILDNYSLQ